MATQAEAVHQYAVARRFPRHKIDLPVRVVVPLPDKTRIVSGRGNELNEGGLSVFAGTEMRVGDSIFIEFTPPYSGKPVRVAARVCDRNGYNYGVEFSSGSDEQQKRIEEFRLMLRFATGANYLFASQLFLRDRPRGRVGRIVRRRLQHLAVVLIRLRLVT